MKIAARIKRGACKSPNLIENNSKFVLILPSSNPNLIWRCFWHNQNAGKVVIFEGAC
jgi:hypothetical protein